MRLYKSIQRGRGTPYQSALHCLKLRFWVKIAGLPINTENIEEEDKLSLPKHQQKYLDPEGYERNQPYQKILNFS